MLTTPTVQQIPSTSPLVHAFRVTGTVTSEDMEAMARHMNAAFEAVDDTAAEGEIGMLLIFEAFEGREMGAAMNAETMKAQFKSLSQVAKYAVVGAPDAAESMIGVMDRVIPVDARTFDAGDEAAAWAWVGATPA